MATPLNDDLPFAAVHDHVIVLRPSSASRTKGGIELPQAAQKPYQYGFVAFVGPKVEGVNAGDWVLFDPTSTTPVFFDNPNKTIFEVVPEPAIYARLTPTKASELELQMPQMDALDVLSRSQATATSL